MLTNYCHLLNICDGCLDEGLEPDLVSRIFGTKSQMLDQTVFFGMLHKSI